MSSSESTRADHPGRHSRLPAYQRIARTIRERIDARVYVPGEYLPTERDLADEFRASRQTVRCAIDILREEGLLAPEQGRGTLIVAAGDSTGTPDRAESPLNLAALVIYGISRDGSAGILEGCQSVMRHGGYHLVVCETPHDTGLRAAQEAAHLRDLIDKGIGGAIIYAEPTDRNRALIEEAMSRGISIVQIDRYLPGLDCDYVGIDNERAAREMVHHLSLCGHRRIAFLTIDPEATTCEERVAGYRAAVDELGLAEIVVRCSGAGDMGPALDAILAGWRQGGDMPDAVFAVNDLVALELMQASRRLGLRLPDELAIAGFDDCYAAALVSPALTTVRQHFAALGQAAADMLLDRMRGVPCGVARRVLCPTELVVRESCGFHLPRPVRHERRGAAVPV